MRLTIKKIFNIFIFFSVFECCAGNDFPSCGLSTGKGVYLAGFVIEQSSKNNIGGADVLVFHRNKLIKELQTNSDGWYEMDKPLSNGCVGLVLKILVFAKGYKSKEFTHIVKPAGVSGAKIPNNYNDVYIEKRSYSSFSNAFGGVVPTGLYGFVYDKNGEAIDLSVVTVMDRDNKKALGKSITRESGYFNWQYDKTSLDHQIHYYVDHEYYNKKKGNMLLDGSFLSEELNKDLRDNWILSLGVQFVLYADTDSDSNRVNSSAISNDQLVFNLTVFDELLTKDSSFHNDMSWRRGKDISFAYSRPYVYDNNGGKDRIEKIELYTFGAGFAWVAKNSSILVRTGFSVSSESDIGFYAGISMPLFYIKNIFK